MRRVLLLSFVAWITLLPLAPKSVADTVSACPDHGFAAASAQQYNAGHTYAAYALAEAARQRHPFSRQANLVIKQLIHRGVLQQDPGKSIVVWYVLGGSIAALLSLLVLLSTLFAVAPTLRRRLFIFSILLGFGLIYTRMVLAQQDRAVVLAAARIRVLPDPKSNALAKLPAGATIEIIDRRVDYDLAEFGEVTGWVSRGALAEFDWLAKTCD